MIRLDEGGLRRQAHLIAPPPGLRGAVEHLWVHGKLPRDSWRIVPDLGPHLIFYTAGSTVACRIVGARSTYCDIDVSGRDLTIGVRLRPGVLPRLIGDSAAQLTDRSESLEAVIGLAGRRLTERLGEGTSSARLRLLEEFLSDRLRDCGAIWPSTARSVADLGHTWGVPRRSAYAKALDAIGCAPRVALRIQRLHVALAHLHSGASLAEVALRASYCDQAHLTRESVRLLGAPPGEWRLRGCPNVQDREAQRDR